MFKKNIFLLLLFSLNSALAKNSFNCYNDNVLKTSLILSQAVENKWLVQNASAETCDFIKVDFESKNENYHDWIKVEPDTNFCSNLNGLFPIKNREIYQILISPKIQNGYNGFVQINFESQGHEHGPKKIKTFLNCISK